MRTLLLATAVAALTTAGLVLTAADDPKPKADAKKEGPKPVAKADANPPIHFIEYAKPKMVDYHDLPGVPLSLHWGADVKEPYLFVETAAVQPKPRGGTDTGSVSIYRPRSEDVVAWCPLPAGYHLLGVFPDAPTLVTGRIDSGGINSLRRLRYLRSTLPFEGMSQNLGREPRENGALVMAENRFSPAADWVEPAKPSQFNGTLALDTLAGGDFKLTADAKGLWNTYVDTDEPGSAGLRRLDPRSGEVTKTLPLAATWRPTEVRFDRAGGVAVVALRTQVKNVVGPRQAAGYDLAAGRVTWTATAPENLQQAGVAVSADGKVAAVAYETQPGFTADYNKLSAEERQKAEDALPTPVVRVLDAGTGKRLKEIALKKREDVTSIELSADGRLLLTQGYGSVGGWTAQLFDAATGRRVHAWAGSGLFAFRTGPAGRPLLAVAERVGKDGQDKPAFQDDDRGRLGIWQIEATEVEVEQK